jgi:hypothetical protein
MVGIGGGRSLPVLCVVFVILRGVVAERDLDPRERNGVGTKGINHHPEALQLRLGELQGCAEVRDGGVAAKIGNDRLLRAHPSISVGDVGGEVCLDQGRG